MFNGSIPIILDSLKQHYFIDRDGKVFRHILAFMRSGRLLLPDGFKDWEVLMEEAQYYDIQPLIKDIERLRSRSRSNGVDSSSSSSGSATGGSVSVKVEPGEIREAIDCVWVHISPDLGERISLSADRHMLEEVFPELNSALLDSRNSGWNMDSRFVLRFPLNGFCKLNSLQVMQRLLSHGYTCVASTGGGVEGQQFSDYLLTKKTSF